MAHCFAELKWKGYDCEMTPEYAKIKVWEESYNILNNQFYVSAKQYHSLKRLNGKVDIILTDSPILLGLFYGKDEPSEFKDLLIKYHHSFNNLNIVLQREKHFNPNGRLHSEQESKLIDKEIEKIVNTICNDSIAKIPGSRESIPKIIQLIENNLNPNF